MTSLQSAGVRAALLFFVCSVLFSGEAKALSPASPAQFVCSASHIFSGRVLKATNDEVLHLTIRVDQILGVAAPSEQTASFPVLQKGIIRLTSST